MFVLEIIKIFVFLLMGFTATVFMIVVTIGFVREFMHIGKEEENCRRTWKRVDDERD